MDVTIHLGWWVAPFAQTVISIVWAHSKCPSYLQGGRFSLDGFVYLFFYGIATITSLVAWLIWAVLT